MDTKCSHCFNMVSSLKDLLTADSKCDFPSYLGSYQLGHHSFQPSPWWVVSAHGRGLELHSPFQPKSLHFSMMSFYSILYVFSALLHFLFFLLLILSLLSPFPFAYNTSLALTHYFTLPTLLESSLDLVFFHFIWKPIKK